MILDVHRPLIFVYIRILLYPSSSYVSIISLLLSKITDLLDIRRTNIYAFIKSQLSQVFFLMPHSAQNGKVLFSNHSLTLLLSRDRSIDSVAMDVGPFHVYDDILSSLSHFVAFREKITNKRFCYFRA